MMVAPVDADIEITHHIATEDRQQRSQTFQCHVVRRAQFQHHDRDDDSDHAVAERFNSAGGHPLNPWLSFVSAYALQADLTTSSARQRTRSARCARTSRLPTTRAW